MLLIVRASQKQVLDGLATRPSGVLVGPTSPAGWTSIWSDEEELQPDEFSEVVMIAEQETGLVVQVLALEERRQCILSPELTPSNEMRDLAASLCRLFDAPQAEVDILRTLVQADGSEDELVGNLAALLSLPAVNEPRPVRALVAHQGDPRSALLAGRLGGPTYLTPLDDGWSVLSDVDDPGEYLTLAMGAALAGSRRRSTVMALWRSSPEGAGYVLFRGEEITAYKTWNTGWREVRDHAPGDSATVELALRLTRGNADAVALRSLLRASSWPTDPLAELVPLVGLPAEVIAVLDSPSGTQPTTQRLAPSSAARAWWEVVRSGGGEDPIAPRWLRWLFAVGTAIAAVVCLGMTVLTIAVVLTDGAAIDQTSVTVGDWVWVAVFVGLTLILAPTTVWRVGRARR